MSGSCRRPSTKDTPRPVERSGFIWGFWPNHPQRPPRDQTIRKAALKLANCPAPIFPCLAQPEDFLLFVQEPRAFSQATGGGSDKFIPGSSAASSCQRRPQHAAPLSINFVAVCARTWRKRAHPASGTRRDQATDNDVLFQANQRVDLARNSRFGEHAGGFLEGCGRDEGRVCRLALVIPSKNRMPDGRLPAFSLTCAAFSRLETPAHGQPARRGRKRGVAGIQFRPSAASGERSPRYACR